MDLDPDAAIEDPSDIMARVIAAAEGKAAYKTAMREAKAKAVRAATAVRAGQLDTSEMGAAQLNAQQRLMEAEARAAAASATRAAAEETAAAENEAEDQEESRQRNTAWVSQFAKKGTTAEEALTRAHDMALEMEERAARLQQEQARLRLNTKRVVRSNRL